jgi:hypothetical protein
MLIFHEKQLLKMQLAQEHKLQRRGGRRSGFFAVKNIRAANCGSNEVCWKNFDYLMLFGDFICAHFTGYTFIFQIIRVYHA